MTLNLGFPLSAEKRTKARRFSFSEKSAEFCDWFLNKVLKFPLEKASFLLFRFLWMRKENESKNIKRIESQLYTSLPNTFPLK